jgi:hypothetical protein
MHLVKEIIMHLISSGVICMKGCGAELKDSLAVTVGRPFVKSLFKKEKHQCTLK